MQTMKGPVSLRGATPQIPTTQLSVAQQHQILKQALQKHQMLQKVQLAQGGQQQLISRQALTPQQQLQFQQLTQQRQMQQQQIKFQQQQQQQQRSATGTPPKPQLVMTQVRVWFFVVETLLLNECVSVMYIFICIPLGSI